MKNTLLIFALCVLTFTAFARNENGRKEREPAQFSLNACEKKIIGEHCSYINNNDREVQGTCKEKTGDSIELKCKSWTKKVVKH